MADDTGSTDVLVVGAGPAGLAAAAGAAAGGLDVTVVDENPRPGGQIWRQPFVEAVPRRATTERGPIRPAALPSTVRFVGSTVCVGFAEGREAVLASPHGPARLRAQAVVVATGGVERVLPVPGWTLPGVMTAGAAQTLLKGSGVFPYRRVVVSGTGPLLLAAAAQLLHDQVKVAAVVEAARPSPASARLLPGILAGGRLLWDGLGYLSTLARHRVPVLTGRGVAEVLGRDAVTGVVVRRLRADWSFDVGPAARHLDCDAVLFNHGFCSSVELAAQLGARVVWDERRQSWTPERDDWCETSQPLVYAAGDCAGVGGAQVAALEGALVGVALTRRMCASPPDRRAERRIRRRLARLAIFRDAMDELSRVGPRAVTWAEPDTIVCRCQGSTLGQLRDAISDGVTSLHGVKLWSRAGMGRCQGRVCAPVVRELLRASAADAAMQIDPPHVRFPVRPAPVRAIAGLTDTQASVADGRDS